jgi:RHS repeat-associated protein
MNPMGDDSPPVPGFPSAAAASSRSAAAVGAEPLLPSGTSLPKGGGAIRGLGEKFTVNPARGTGSLSVPLAISAGRSGAAPAVALDYDSGAGNSPFGLGFDVRIPAVSRRTARGVPRYDDGDVHLLSDAEDLVPALVAAPDGSWTADVRTETVDGSAHRVQRFRPRHDTAFTRIERCEDLATGQVFWRTVSRDNVRSVFGRTPAGRVADPADDRRVFQWLLEEVRDDRGNVAAYEYKAEDLTGVSTTALHERHRLDGPPPARRYLKRIRYGNRTPGRCDPACFLVVFDYGEHGDGPAEERPWPVRPDPYSDHRAGFELRTWRLCRRVLMFHDFPEEFADGPNPRLVASTDLVHAPDEVATKLVSVTHTGYDWDPEPGGYRTSALPPLEFGYTTAAPDTVTRRVQSPPVPDGDSPYWVDLDGEGVPGALRRYAGAWWYQRNLGGGRLGVPEPVAAVPSPGTAASGSAFPGTAASGPASPGTAPAGSPSSGGRRLQLADLAGDGRLCLVDHGPGGLGSAQRDGGAGWSPFRPFRDNAVLDLDDPGLRQVDLDGDGLPDLLLGAGDTLMWHRGAGREGWGPRRTVTLPGDEEKGPRLAAVDATYSVFTADLTGDGLADLVRVGQGEVCYWPGIGHGRFGPKVTMDGAPVLDGPGAFDPRRVRFADLDGSGPADLLHLGGDGVHWWRNLSGNGFGPRQCLDAFPRVDGLGRADTVDLLGTGTPCLVWSSPLEPGTVRYLDLARGTDTGLPPDDPRLAGWKPHLLSRVRNNFGAETRIEYAPSTRYYLADRDSAEPERRWVTTLPFPVHVVAASRVTDGVSGADHAGRFLYRHGCFDGVEREFRGFGMTESQDTETFAGTPLGDLDLPPVRTRSWFHTGGHADARAGAYGGDPLAVPLPPHRLDGVTGGEEHRQALRVLTGMPLRTEVYADDGTLRAAHPYTVTEYRYRVALVQPAAAPAEQGRPAPLSAWSAWAAFTSHDAETLTSSYERDPADPRVSHTLTLDVDPYGTVLSSAAVGYGRRVPAVPEQRPTVVTWARRTVANSDTSEVHRLGTLVEESTFEVTGLAEPAGGRHTPDGLREAFAGSAEIPYEASPAPAAVQRRCVERSCVRYWSDALDGPLPLGLTGSRALPHQVRRLAFTPGLLDAVHGPRADAGLLTAEGGYVFEDGLWWAPSAVNGYDPAAFFLPVTSTSPFGNISTVTYDRYGLLPTATAASRTAPYDTLVTTLGNDYRVLAPRQVTEPNGNRSRSAFDPLGMVTATWTQGKAGGGEGDPDGLPGVLYTYDLDAWRTTGGPARVSVDIRERHGDPDSPLQRSRVYTDGLGRVAMTKYQAEPGLAWALDADGRPVQVDTTPEPRWIGSGRTVYNNKTLPVESYEPYFSATPDYEHADALVEQGVTPVLRYDPLGRLVRTDHPDGTVTRAEFDPWRQVTWDTGDTVLDSRWYADRQGPGTPPAEQRAAELAAAYAGTPGVAVLDTLGRTVRTREDNGPHGVYETTTDLDVEGNCRSVTDARGVRVLEQLNDITGRVVRAAGADAGERRQLHDCTGALIRRWDPVGHTLAYGYDALRRPTETWVTDPADPAGPAGPAGTAPRLADLTVYGETHPQAARRNLLGRALRRYDQAGVAVTEGYDLQGNAVGGTRVLAAGDAEPDWAPLHGQPLSALDALAAGLLDAGETFTTSAEYDALDRPVTQTLPDGTRIRPRYGPAGLLTAVDAWLGTAAAPVPFVTGIDHDAKRRRTRIAYAGGTATTYTYDRFGSRLRELVTLGGSTVLQSLAYTYDPAGNVTEITDAAQQTVFFDGAVLPPLTRYTYDPLYRLRTATGREHSSLGVQPDAGEPGYAPLPHPNDAQALRGWTETYDYDQVGNMLTLAHAAGPTGSWTRRCRYGTASNRLLSHSRPGDPAGGPDSALFTHDAGGRMTAMPHLPGPLTWDHADRLTAVDLAGGGTVRYAHDSSGSRVRRTVTRLGGLTEELIGLGGYEVYRRRRGGTVVFERTTVHVFDGLTRAALAETVTVDTDHGGADEAPVVRFQLSNHLGSCAVEVTDTGQVLSYEEYHPFGTTALWLAAGAARVSTRRYRYTGREKDDGTGLYRHGVRHYAGWLARWTSPDPAGLADGPNPYEYVRGNPVRLTDPSGTQSTEDHDEAARHTARVQRELSAHELTPEIVRDFADETRTRGQLMGKYGVVGFFRIRSRVRDLPGDVLVDFTARPDTTVYIFPSGRQGTLGSEQGHRAQELNIGTPLGAIPRVIARAAGASEQTVENIGQVADLAEAVLPLAAGVVRGVQNRNAQRASGGPGGGSGATAPAGRSAPPQAPAAPPPSSPPEAPPPEPPPAVPLSDEELTARAKELSDQIGAALGKTPERARSDYTVSLTQGEGAQLVHVSVTTPQAHKVLLSGRIDLRDTEVVGSKIGRSNRGFTLTAELGTLHAEPAGISDVQALGGTAGRTTSSNYGCASCVMGLPPGWRHVSLNPNEDYPGSALVFPPWSMEKVNAYLRSK